MTRDNTRACARVNAHTHARARVWRRSRDFVAPAEEMWEIRGTFFSAALVGGRAESAEKISSISATFFRFRHVTFVRTYEPMGLYILSQGCGAGLPVLH